MDLAQILRKLWSLRLFVGLVAIVAAFVGLTSAYRLSVFPPGLESKGFEVGAASTELLVDSNESPLAALNDQYIPLTERAAIYARFMGSPPVQKAIADEVGLEPYQIFSQSPEAINPAAAEANGANGADPGAVETPAVAAGGAPYQLTFLPRANIVSVYAQGPTARAAERLANGAVDAFQKWIEGVQEMQNISAGARIELRQLGRARGGMITEGADRKMAALTFLGLLGGGCVLILALSNLVTNLRRAQVADHLEHANGNGNGLLAADDYAHLEPLSQDLQPAGRASGSRASQEF